MLRKLLLAAGLAGMLILGGAVLAQDATPTIPMEGEVPAEGEMVEGATLGDVTADSAAYYGQQVTLEGILEEYVNARTFVLGEGAVLFDSKVLVINNSAQEFDPSLVTGERVRITGIVVPSYDEGGFNQVIGNFNGVSRPLPGTTDPAAPVQPAAPADPNAQPVLPAGTFDYTPLTNAIAERYAHFTILEVTSMEAAWLPPQ